MKVKAINRTIIGKKSKNLRKEGIVSAVAYGPKLESVNLAVNIKEVTAAFNKAGFNKLVDFETETGKYKALFKEIQRQPVTNEYYHVSFYVVDMEQEIDADVPVHIEGISPAVKNNIGFLEVAANTLSVRCLPADIPGDIVVNVENLNEIGDNIAISDLNLGDKVKLMNVEMDFKLVVITPPQKIEEEVVEAVAEGDAEAGTEGEETEAGTDAATKE